MNTFRSITVIEQDLELETRRALGGSGMGLGESPWVALGGPVGEAMRRALGGLGTALGRAWGIPGGALGGGLSGN